LISVGSPEGGRLKAAFVIGPCPEGKCGVGDYTRLLATALEHNGVNTEILECPGRSAFRAFRLRAAIKRFRPDITHIQYPTAGFGKGLTPQLLSMLTPSVLTVHEMEGTHLLRRLSFYPLWLRTRHVIFTCESNRQYALRWAPWLREMSSVVPLPSNIPARPHGGNAHPTAEVVHFGLVRPDKGIEDVLELARLAFEGHLPVTFRVVGSSPAQHATYLSGVQRASVALPVIWDLDLSAEAVADRLAQATVAYMPFPDGASERRASLLATLANGLPVITTKGRFTPPGLEGAVWFCSSPREALAAAQALLEAPVLREKLAARGRQYAEKFSWESIAQSHITIYEQLLATHANRD